MFVFAVSGGVPPKALEMTVMQKKQFEEEFCICVRVCMSELLESCCALNIYTA